MPRVVITLGSNIERERNLPEAIRLLAAATRVVAVSSVYETRPVGRTDQEDFFNAAAVLDTDLPAAALKDGLLGGVERALKRERGPDRNAPRTIDLDIALYGDESFDYTPADGRPRHVPDPDLLRFAHCLLPVAELLPDTPHPETGIPLGEMARALMLSIAAGDEPPIWRQPAVDLRALLAGG